jgi:hypothetical protein
MSRKGNPYDNAAVESFMKTLKTEEVYLWEYQTMEDAQRRLPYFIEDVYNQKRLHASLGYCSPVEYEAMLVPETLAHPPSDSNLTVQSQGCSSRLLITVLKYKYFSVKQRRYEGF